MQPLKDHKRNYAVVVGGIFILLAAIGAITVAIFSFRLTASLLDNQRQKTEMERFLTPVVMFDPVPFETPADIDNQKLLLYSMWETLSSNKATSYSRSEENFTLLVPASDIEVSARNLFRDKVSLVHESFTDNESIYYYNEEISSYEVTTSGFLYVYHPEVTEIIKNEDNYEIVVQYIPPDNAWSSIYKGEGSSMGEKKVTYVVGKTDGQWELLALKNPSEEGFYQGETGQTVYESSGDSGVAESSAPPETFQQESQPESSEMSVESSQAELSTPESSTVSSTESSGESSSQQTESSEQPVSSQQPESSQQTTSSTQTSTEQGGDTLVDPSESSTGS